VELIVSVKLSSNTSSNQATARGAEARRDVREGENAQSLGEIRSWNGEFACSQEIRRCNRDMTEKGSRFDKVTICGAHMIACGIGRL